jgi:hypothetical protein
VLDRGKRLVRGFAFTYASHTHEAGRARLRELACWVALAAARERQAERPSEKNPQEKKNAGRLLHGTNRTELDESKRAPPGALPLRLTARGGRRVGGGAQIQFETRRLPVAGPQPASPAPHHVGRTRSPDRSHPRPAALAPCPGRLL